MKVDGLKVEVLPITFYKNTSLERAIEHLFVEADRAYRDGANILILSDIIFFKLTIYSYGLKT